MWADNAYVGLADWARNDLDLTFKVVIKPPNQVGFNVLPRRWIVERSLVLADARPPRLPRLRTAARTFRSPHRLGEHHTHTHDPKTDPSLESAGSATGAAGSLIPEAHHSSGSTPRLVLPILGSYR